MASEKEMVLYFNGNSSSHAPRLKSVLVQMGVRIKNIDANQTHQLVGYLAGMDGFESLEIPESSFVIEEEVLVLKNFTGNRIDQLLGSLKRAGVPKIQLKAVLTPTNSNWTFYDLYLEIKKEHETMSPTIS